MPQQKERDATLADRPCPTIHVSMLAHLNVLWCPDFILWGLFLLAGRGCLFWGSHATGQPRPSLWPWIAALRCLVLCCPCLSAAARPGPRLPMAQVHGVHAQALSVWLCRCCCFSGLAAQVQGGGAFRGVPWRALSVALVFWLRFGRCRCLAEPRKFARLY